jgi:hypothetical protein
VGFCGHKKRKASGSSTSSASTLDNTNLVRNQGDFSGALGVALSQRANTFSLQDRQQAVDGLLLSPRDVSDPRPASTGGRVEPLPPLRGAREAGPVKHQPVRPQSPHQDFRGDETGQVREKVTASYKPRPKVSDSLTTKLPGLKCLQPRAESKS